MIGVRAEPNILVEAVDRFDFLIGQFEIEDIGIGLDVILAGRFGNRDNICLQHPTQCDMHSRFAIFLTDFNQLGNLEDTAPHDRCPGRDGDVIALAEIH